MFTEIIETSETGVLCNVTRCIDVSNFGPTMITDFDKTSEALGKNEINSLITETENKIQQYERTKDKVTLGAIVSGLVTVGSTSYTFLAIGNHDYKQAAILGGVALVSGVLTGCFMDERNVKKHFITCEEDNIQEYSNAKQNIGKPLFYSRGYF